MAFKTIQKRKRVSSLTSCLLTTNEPYVNEVTHSIDIRTTETDVLSSSNNPVISVEQFSLKELLASGQPLKKVNTCVLDGVTAPPDELLNLENDES